MVRVRFLDVPLSPTDSAMITHATYLGQIISTHREQNIRMVEPMNFSSVRNTDRGLCINGVWSNRRGVFNLYRHSHNHDILVVCSDSSRENCSTFSGIVGATVVTVFMLWMIFC